MKNRIYRLIIFFAGLVLLAFWLNVGIIKVIKCNPNGKFGTLNRLVQGKINAQILISGSSRADNHFNPDIISRITHKSSYNIGQNGEQLNIQLPILKTYLKYNTPPEILIQSLDIFTLTYQKHIVNKDKYYPYLLDEPILYEGLAKFDNEIVKMKYIPLYGYIKYCNISDILSHMFKKEDYLIRGFRGLEANNWNADYEKFKMKNAKGKIFPVEDKSLEDLNKIIQLCKKYNIKLVFVFSPEYYEAYQLEKNRSEIIDIYKELADENNISFYDYSNTAITKQKILFCNANHLNLKGANIFSEDIASKLSKRELNSIRQDD